MEQSSWVDSSRWVDGDDDDAPVEYLEAEPSAYRLSEVAETEKRSSGQGSQLGRIIGFGGVAVILIALAIMSRPGDEDPVSQLPANDQQEIRQRQAELDDAALDQTDNDQTNNDQTDNEQPDARASADGSLTDGQEEAADASADGDADTGAPADSDVPADTDAAPRPIPELREDLPQDFPGVLFSYGSNDAVITIRRSVAQPTEEFLGPVGEGVETPAALVQTSESEVSVVSDGRLHTVLATGGSQSFDLGGAELLPSDAGFMLVVEQERAFEAYVFDDDNTLDDTTGPEPIDVGGDLEILGGWEGKALVSQAGRIWLLDTGGGSQPVTDGVLLGYNGQHLAMVRCAAPGDCRIEVGTPDQPAQRSIPVPEALAGRDISLWAGTGTVSPDGRRLGLIERRGAVWLPAWIDLETGVQTGKSESVGSASRVVWSPDGRWLAYAFDSDILVWDSEVDRTWRLFIGRPISSLAWLEDPELDDGSG